MSNLNSLEDKVEYIVGKLTGYQNMFSAFDVTKILRLFGETVRHSSKVRPIVHRLFDEDDMGIYHRDLHYVHGIGGINVFHPPFEDYTNYDPHWIENYGDTADFKAQFDLLDQDSSSSTPSSHITSKTASSVKSFPVPNQVVNKDGSITVRCTNDRRLNIPSKLLSKIGLTDKVVLAETTICPGGGKPSHGILIKGGNTSDNTTGKKLRVDREHRIRINPTFLKSVFGESYPDSFVLINDTSHIYVYEA